MKPDFRPPVPAWRQRLGEVRHDLRSPLSEILGFTEMMVEEARERNLAAFVDGLESIRQSANRILADVNHAFNYETPRLNIDVLRILNRTIHELTGGMLEVMQDLSTRCEQLRSESFAEDLVRISGSAKRLREFAPGALDVLIELGASSEGFSVPGESPAPFDVRSRESAPAVPAELGGRLLVVDDQDANRTLLSRRLSRRGYTVDAVENGRLALERLRAEPFDLILLDILMPEMDGMEVLRRVKSDPELTNIPVLMLSALDDLDAVVRCIELGAEDYLPKPFPAAILHARVEACLANKRMSDQLRKYTGWLFGKTLFSNAVAAPLSLALSRQQRTILFADIRGFTRWSESNPPEAAVAMLNCYFESAEKIWRNSPVIKTEYTGDEIMGVFPSAAAAVRVAQALRQEIGRLLERWALGVGVGVHTGPVIEGLMGGTEVKAYRFVGDTVNTGRRICSEARAGQVLIGETTLAEVRPLVTIGPAFELFVKGKADPLKLWPLQDVAAPADAS